MHDAERPPLGVDEVVRVPEPVRRLRDEYADSAGVSGFMSFAALRVMPDSGLPCTSSMTRKYSSPSWPTSMMRTTFG